MKEILKVTGLNVNYGAIHAIHDVSLTVNEGEVVSLIGANGAGKTTILHTITGLTKAASGSVLLNGTELLTTEPHKIVTMGMAHVPEGRHVFAQMTVTENLEMGAYFRRDKDQVEKDLADVLRRFPRLAERSKQLAGTLSGGEQQMLAVGRALMSHPRILLLDEPSMGLSPLLVKEIFTTIEEVNREGVTILLVEQNANLALETASYVYVLETGRVVNENRSEVLLRDDTIQKAYLGL